MKQYTPDIITIGCDDYTIDGNLQRRDKIKGIVQQKLISAALGIHDDISIHRILDEITAKAHFLYQIEIPVKINKVAYPFRRERYT